VGSATGTPDRVAGRGPSRAGPFAWPAAGALLGLLALAEATGRVHGSGPEVPAALLLALAGTAPLALAGGRPRAAASVVLPAALLSAVVLGWVTTGALLAVLAVLLPAGRSTLDWVRQARGEAADRRAGQAALLEDTLEHVARGERARIARELHDVVAHHISLIAVQAETTRLTTPGMPEEGARRLVAIGDTARVALTEMRRLLGVLREDAEAVPTRQPQPGLEQLAELVDETRAATGSSTRLIVHGRVRPLDAGIQLTAYRIVQEALTNARRHAGPAAVDVELQFAPDVLLIRVRDNGPGPGAADLDAGGAPRAGAGHGLVGMRERVAMVGGQLQVGPAPGGGLLVRARLPTGASP
jgi:signal transduction histidine kinase